MTNDERAEAERICKARQKIRWKRTGCRIDIKRGTDESTIYLDMPVADFFMHALTGYAAALEDNATWAREFAVLQKAHLKLREAHLKLDAAYSGERKECLALLMAGAEWLTDGRPHCSCGDCAECRLGILIKEAPSPPSVPSPLLEENERLAKDAAAYREMLEVGRKWVKATDCIAQAPCCCGRCPACALMLLIQDAAPVAPPFGEEGRQESPKNGLDSRTAAG